MLLSKAVFRFCIMKNRSVLEKQNKNKAPHQKNKQTNKQKTPPQQQNPQTNAVFFRQDMNNEVAPGRCLYTHFYRQESALRVTFYKSQYPCSYVWQLVDKFVLYI